MKLNKDTINLLVISCVLLWNIYDFFDCIFQGNCGWRREINIPEFGFTRFIHSIPNLFLGSLLFWWALLSIKDAKSKNVNKKQINRKHTGFMRYGVKKKNIDRKRKSK